MDSGQITNGTVTCLAMLALRVGDGLNWKQKNLSGLQNEHLPQIPKKLTNAIHRPSDLQLTELTELFLRI